MQNHPFALIIDWKLSESHENNFGRAKSEWISYCAWKTDYFTSMDDGDRSEILDCLNDDLMTVRFVNNEWREINMAYT